MDKEKILEAGRITKEVREWIKPQIKPGIPLLELAKKIENKIIELGGKPAFPANLSINEIAAHYTPSHDDTSVAEGLLKVDFGTQVDGWTADNAFTVDLENNEENKKLISASEEALENALKIIKENISTDKIGQTIQEKIDSHGLSPIVNLSGHSMDRYELHAGITIPNINDKRNKKLSSGLYAIEPFATNGNGKVKDGNPSEIYELINERNPRSSNAREILNFIIEEYQGLPFCSRWIVDEFGTKSLLALRELESNGNLHQFSQLVETSKANVSQAEHTVFIDDEGKVIVTTF